jgi:regulator of sigma E protease
MTIFVALIGLGVIVFIHELGHFSVSLALHMRPRKFYIGFPPAIVKTTRGGIEYGIGMVPLGGFVKIPGMHRPTSVDVDNAFGRAVDEAPALAGPIDRLRRALRVGDHLAAGEALRALDGLLEEHDLSSAAARSARRGIDDIADGLGSDAYWRAKTWKRVLVIFAGPAANVVLALALFTGLFMTSGGKATTTVESVVKNTPAAAIGLQAGDRIVSINGVPVRPSDISRTISASHGKPLFLTVERDQRLIRIGPGEAKKSSGAYRLGFVLRGVGLPPPQAAKESLRITGRVSADIVSSLGRLVTGDGRKDISSPVGIVQGSSDAAKEGTGNFLWVLGLISLSVALLNLLPLLPLDGGHIVFSVIEGVRGRAVRREIYERVSIIGIGLVLLLFFIGLSNDIGRLS